MMLFIGRFNCAKLTICDELYNLSSTFKPEQDTGSRKSQHLSIKMILIILSMCYLSRANSLIIASRHYVKNS